MSELGEIHEKVNAIAVKVATIDKELKIKLPALATRDEFKLGIAEHVQNCKRGGGVDKKLIGALLAVAAAVVGLAQALN